VIHREPSNRGRVEAGGPDLHRGRVPHISPLRCGFLPCPSKPSSAPPAHSDARQVESEHGRGPGSLSGFGRHALPHLQLLPKTAPHFATPCTRVLFERSLETMRLRYRFCVFEYVVMPEHVHILVTEPKKALLSRAIQALKLSVAVQSRERPFWQARYYDFNVFTTRKQIEKLKYIHRNPVTRGLVDKPEDWP
jgi:REP element-mobilizing transposase RayT